MTAMQSRDSVLGQGSRSDQSLIGLSLRQNGIASQPREGALRTQCALKHLSANGPADHHARPRTLCENVAPRANNRVARQRVLWITLAAHAARALYARCTHVTPQFRRQK